MNPPLTIERSARYGQLARLVHKVQQAEKAMNRFSMKRLRHYDRRAVAASARRWKAFTKLTRLFLGRDVPQHTCGCPSLD